MVHEIVDEQGFLIDLIFNTINKKIKNFAVNKIKFLNYGQKADDNRNIIKKDLLVISYIKNFSKSITSMFNKQTTTLELDPLII